MLKVQRSQTFRNSRAGGCKRRFLRAPQVTLANLRLSVVNAKGLKGLYRGNITKGLSKFHSGSILNYREWNGMQLCTLFMVSD